MHKDTKFCYSSFEISTFGFKAPPYCSGSLPIRGLLDILLCSSDYDVLDALRGQLLVIFISDLPHFYSGDGSKYGSDYDLEQRWR